MNDTAGHWKSINLVLKFPFKKFRATIQDFFTDQSYLLIFIFIKKSLILMPQMAKQCYFKRKYIKFYADFQVYQRIDFWRQKSNTAQWLCLTGRHCFIFKIHICPRILFTYLVALSNINHMHYLVFLYVAGFWRNP